MKAAGLSSHDQQVVLTYLDCADWLSDLVSRRLAIARSKYWLGGSYNEGCQHIVSSDAAMLLMLSMLCFDFVDDERGRDIFDRDGCARHNSESRIVEEGRGRIGSSPE